MGEGGLPHIGGPTPRESVQIWLSFLPILTETDNSVANAVGSSFPRTNFFSVFSKISIVL